MFPAVIAANVTMSMSCATALTLTLTHAYSNTPLRTTARKDSVSGKPADMVLAPLDSRNFAEQDYMMRAQLRGGKTGGWRERCVCRFSCVFLCLVFSLVPSLLPLLILCMRGYFFLNCASGVTSAVYSESELCLTLSITSSTIS
jgi:hypothetical protein